MDLRKFKAEAQKDLNILKSTQDLEKWRAKYLGRKSPLSLLRKRLNQLPLEERKQKGKEINEIQQALADYFREQKQKLETQDSISQDYFDITQPGKKFSQGHLHPLTLTFRQIINAFEKLGFAIVEGPEIETEYYNFDALNIPVTHPARDMWDTLWLRQSKIKNKLLLRTHTSPVQIRFMEKNNPPLRIIVPGKCFRHEATDATHEIQFHQVEGLMISEEISLANFKAVVTEVMEEIFTGEKKIKLRFRPSFFPFVSPGIEIDIKIEDKSEWLEIMGAGMVHPNLFKNVGYKSNYWQGFAFGLGVERIAMIKYGINDIRLFFNPDIRFLRQF